MPTSSLRNPGAGHTSVASSSQKMADKVSTPAALARPVDPVIIESIATGVPGRAKKQAQAADEVAELFKSSPEQQERIRRLYAKTKIDTRHMVVDPVKESFDRAMPIRQRMDMFLEHAAPLAIDVCTRALAEARVTKAAEQIGMLVLVTSTGFIAPGVDVAIMKALGLSPAISRAVINFMGCAAAMNGLRAAADFVRCHGDSKALVCCVELSSVNAVFADNINDVVISSLFADGCAAMVVGSGRREALPGQVVIRHHLHHFVDGSLDGITLGVNDDGITCDLSAKLPLYIRSGLGPIIQNTLTQQGLAKKDVDLWAIHPGGPKIIEESITSLGLDAGVATKSWDVLAEYGNMLSASLPFVLQRMVAEARTQRPVSKGVAFSFAPGITVEGMLFDVVGDEAAVSA